MFSVILLDAPDWEHTDNFVSLRGWDHLESIHLKASEIVKLTGESPCYYTSQKSKLCELLQGVVDHVPQIESTGVVLTHLRSFTILRGSISSFSTPYSHQIH